METDILVVGGGPSGLNAAIFAASYGAHVTIIDESPYLGGQLRQQTQWYDNLPIHFEPGQGTVILEKLINQVESIGVEVLLQHTMIGTYQNGNIGVTDGKRTFEIEAKKVIITPGAAEEADIFPGWTLPGVMTVGAAQILINREFVLPGKNAVIVGGNEFALEVCLQLHECGVKIEGIVERNEVLSSSNKKLLENLDSKGIPVFTNSKVERATGSGEVEKVFLQSPDRLVEIDADLVCVANGFSPVIEPFEILSCEFIYNEDLGGWLPKYNSRFQTSNPSVFLAGNATGITSIGAILLTGEIAALHTLDSIGLIDGEEAEGRKASLWNELREVEMKSNANTYQARLKIIKDFHKESQLTLPDYLNTISGGIMNG